LTYNAILDLNNRLNSTDSELHDYIENRVVPGTYFYETEGDKAKSRYLWMRGLSAVAGAFVPVLVNVSIPSVNISLITTVLSLAVAILVSLGAYCTTASVTGITVQPPMPLRGNVTSCS
jgi:VIT1/CCC1 family predicted Fe2+/Mn2+ transporter